MLNSKVTWTTCPAHLTLSEDEVHVWRASLDMSSEDLLQLENILSVEEKMRVQRFYHVQEWHRWVASRGMLKVLLGYYRQIDPRMVQFNYGPHGKPHLHSCTREMDLQFNLSHSANMILYSFARHRRLGIDVEQVALNMPYERIVQRYFSAYEQQFLASLPEASRPRAFFRCWTWKEAYSKACGRGISLVLNPLCAAVRPGEPAVLLPERESTQEVSSLLLQELDPGEEFVGTIAVEGLHWKLKCWQ